MSVSKRVRYEILRRDQHTCRYCGGTAPDVTLTIDHVTPVALGGSDDPSNLVAACKDCNAGKTSTTPGAPLVADVAQDAIRWSQAMRQALNDLGTTQENLNAYRDMFLDVWEQSRGRWNGEPHPLPDGWEATLNKWAKLGVPINVIEAAVKVPMGKSYVTSSDKFRYFCSVVWRQLDDVRQEVQAHLSPAPNVPLKPCGHCDNCRHRGSGFELEDDEVCVLLQPLEDDEEREVCTVCGEPRCNFGRGVDHGMQWGWSQGYDVGQQKALLPGVFRDAGTRALEAVVDGRL